MRIDATGPDFRLPIFLDARQILAIVIGGGPVGRRKAAMLLAAGARVRLIALEPPSVKLVHPRLDWRHEAYRPEHLHGGQLVFTAAPTSLSDSVMRDAHAHGLFVCRADDAGQGDFVTPIVFKRGRLNIALTTGGASPALASCLTEQLSELFDESFGDWLELLHAQRVRSKASKWPAREVCEAFLKQIAEWRWFLRFQDEGGESVAAAYEELAIGLGRCDSDV